MQAEVTKRLGVHIESLKNWERGATEPMIRYVPKILEFLGYNPESEPAGLAQRLVHIRRQLGLTQEDLAKVLAVDPVTLYRWEKGFSAPPPARVRQIESLLRGNNTLTYR